MENKEKNKHPDVKKNGGRLRGIGHQIYPKLYFFTFPLVPMRDQDGLFFRHFC